MRFLENVEYVYVTRDPTSFENFKQIQNPD